MADKAQDNGKQAQRTETALGGETVSTSVEGAKAARLKSRRRFLGRAAGIAPAAILTLNSSAAMAHAMHSTVMTTKFQDQNPVPDKYGHYSSKIFQQYDSRHNKMKPVCVYGQETSSGDMLKVSTPTDGEFYKKTQSWGGGTTYQCNQGFLVTASSAATFGSFVRDCF